MPILSKGKRKSVAVLGSVRGQSLMEILIAVALGALFVGAAVSIIAPVLRIGTNSTQSQTATALTREFADNIRAWGEGDWHNVANLATSSANHYYLNTSASPFTVNSGNENITLGGATYQRYFYTDDVYRDSSGNITSTGNTYDPSSKKITICVCQGVAGSVGGWAMTTQLPSSGESDGSGVVNNGYIYMTGGEASFPTSTVVYAQLNGNGTIGNWSNTTALPNTLTDQFDAVYNGYIYIVGGANTSTVWYAKPNSTGSISNWSSTTVLPGVIYEASGAIYNGYIYTTGGFGSPPTSTVFYAKLNSTGSISNWSSTTALPNAHYEHSAVAYNGYIYVISGVALQGCCNSPTSSVLYAKLNGDGTVGNWSNTTALPTPLSDHFAVASNGYIYTTGGIGFGQGTSTIFYAKPNADGSLDNWSTASSSMPDNMSDHFAAVYNGYIYTAGANDTWGSYTSTVFYSSIPGTYAPGNSTYTFYLTRAGANAIFDQTDWSGGSGQTGPVSSTNSQFSAVSGTITYASTTGSFSLATTGQVQGATGSLAAWGTTTALPGPIWDHGAVVGNGYVYSAGGYTVVPNSATATVNFAPINSTGSVGNWARTQALPTGTAEFTLMTNNNYIYVPAGNNYSNGSFVLTSTIWYASLNSTGSISNWSSTTQLPTSLYDYFGTIYNGYMYVVGGNSGALTSTVWYSKLNATGSISNWSSTTQAPGAAVGLDLQAGAAYNGYFYLLGGLDSGNNRTSTVSYAPINATGSLGAWSTTTALPSVNYEGSAITNNGYLYLTDFYGPGAVSSTALFAPINPDGSLGSWSTTSLLPTGMNEAPVFMNNNYIYSVGGIDASANASSTVYYSRINARISVANWITTTALPSALIDPSAVAYNGYIYTTGGNNAGTITSTVYYAPLNSTGSISNWSSTTKLPIAMYNPSDYAAAYNGYIYVVGGETNAAVVTSTVYYAPLNSTGSISNWSSTTQLPSSNGLFRHSVVAYNGYIYTTGGIDNIGNFTSTVYYAPLNSTGSISNWSSTTKLPSVLTNHYTVVYNGYIYVTGGESQAGGSGTTTVLYAFLNSTGSISNWSSTISLPNGIKDHFASVYNGYIYAGGGNNASSTVYYAPINATGSLGAWSTTTALPSGLDHFSGVAYNGYIYTTVGSDATGFATSTVFYAAFNPSTTSSPLIATSGTLDSSIYDTGVTSGAQLNSVLWHGSQPAGTSVGFQFAMSNSSNGPWTYIGSDGTGNFYYLIGPDTSLKLDYSLFNNFRYFRYRAQLTSDAWQTVFPRVDEVIVNWSP